MISRIGKRAKVVVTPAKGEVPAKFASAHDLRRSLAERLYDAGVPEREVSRVMRHADAQTTRRHYAPGNVQKAAGKTGQPNCTHFLMGTVSFFRNSKIDVSPLIPKYTPEGSNL